MDLATHTKIISFIWAIAEDILVHPFQRPAIKGGESA